MSIIEEIKSEVEEKWLDPTGFLRLIPSDEADQDFDNENPSLFTSEYVYLLWKLNALSPEWDDHRVKQLIDPLRLEPGLFDRRKGSRDRHFSRDEQIGLITFDLVFGYRLGFARELYEYGRNQSPPYCYQNRNWSSPGKHDRPVFDELGNQISEAELTIQGLRRPRFRELLRSALGKEPSNQGVTEMAVALQVTADSDHKDTSGKILASLQLDVFREHHWLVDIAYANFETKLRQSYGKNYLSGLFDIFFLRQDHPIRRLSKLLT